MGAFRFAVAGTALALALACQPVLAQERSVAAGGCANEARHLHEQEETDQVHEADAPGQRAARKTESCGTGSLPQPLAEAEATPAVASAPHRRRVPRHSARSRLNWVPT